MNDIEDIMEWVRMSESERFKLRIVEAGEESFVEIPEDMWDLVKSDDGDELAELRRVEGILLSSLREFIDGRS